MSRSDVNSLGMRNASWTDCHDADAWSVCPPCYRHRAGVPAAGLAYRVTAQASSSLRTALEARRVRWRCAGRCSQAAQGGVGDVGSCWADADLFERRAGAPEVVEVVAQGRGFFGRSLVGPGRVACPRSQLA